MNELRDGAFLRLMTPSDGLYDQLTSVTRTNGTSFLVAARLRVDNNRTTCLPTTLSAGGPKFDPRDVPLYSTAGHQPLRGQY